MEGTVVSALMVLLSGAMGIIGWQLKRLLTQATENNAELIKLRIILTGETGENGIKGRVEAIEKGLTRDRSRAQERLLLWRIWARVVGDFIQGKHPEFEPPTLDEAPMRRSSDSP